MGLPLAVRAVEAGYHVIGYDINETRVTRLRAGESYIEDVPAERLAAALASGRFEPSADSGAAAGFDIAVITVPTPLRAGVPDLTFVEHATSMLGEHLRPGATVVLESTTYPGTTDDIVAPLLERISGCRAGHDFHLGHSPERIDPGNASWQFENTPKIVSGVNESSLQAIQAFYDTIVHKTVSVASPRVAELAKLLENTFRLVNIALVNELATFTRDLGVDVWEAIDAAATKPYGFTRFVPGPGVGGHCIPVDPTYLSWSVRRSTGRAFRLVELASEINRQMPDYLVSRLTTGLNSRGKPVKGSRILLLGMAYKKNTGDARESPSLRIAERLVAMGAEVRIIDPHVDELPQDDGTRRTDFSAGEIAAADAVILLTDHDSFDLDVVSTHAEYVLDSRNKMRAGTAVEVL
ncbi:UDP-N-acetyl-D-glucosamine dehydrogenase [Phytomonospora endophytica]|uniref:UDP-N-acetyl-D-glucosamine dehydrogenase n=1 Tax=Phytomonospora endophytica TaxID=714109 RepID=A0A841FKF4_9ACTN|nr:UDP-N-acetyl-D-glucosamine dehydrogenase [Phytomonospora endophytica]